jgi:hypothetical protein
MCREIVNVYEISPGIINLDNYKWNSIDDKLFYKKKSDSFIKIEDILDDVIQNILLNE